MSRNAYTLFEKNIFGNGGDMTCLSEMGGGTPDDHQKWPP